MPQSSKSKLTVGRRRVEQCSVARAAESKRNLHGLAGKIDRSQAFVALERWRAISHVRAFNIHDEFA